VVGLLAASAVAIALKPTVLGLDLQGGVEVVLQGKPTDESKVTSEAIDRSVEIIRNRVDAFGVAEPEIQTQGNDQIVVALPGADDPNKVVNDLIRPAQLMFINFSEKIIGPEGGDPSLYNAVKRAQSATPNSKRGFPTYYAFDAKTKQQVPGTQGETDLQTLLDSFPGNRKPAGVVIEKVPQGITLAYQDRGLATRGDSGPKQRFWYVFQNEPGLTGKDITEARSTIQTGGLGSRQRIVTLGFTSEGRKKFADITRDLANQGRLAGELRTFAIILDGQLVSNPSIDYNRYPTGIDGRGGAEIQGDFSQSEADTLAKQINSGALPITLEVISQKQVSATLGKQSLRQGLIAGLVGLALVILFLIAYYRFLGVIAAIGLMIYAVFMYAVIVLVPITLTLPGIAGIILTIGVASDANVVIFERVREEARAGKTPRAAILAGYKKGITAIIDANVVTMATAAILFLFATAGVKGFAFTLFIGVILSLFTAVFATRAIFNVLAETRFLRDDRYMGLHQREIHWKLDFVGKWKLWMAISFVPLAIGAVWIGIHGLNLGLDFESGTRITASFQRPASEDAVRQVFQDLGYGDAKIQSTTETIDGREVHGFQMQTKTLQPAQQREVQQALDARFGIDESTYQLDLVGPTFGKQIIRNAIWAILLSFAVIIIYLSIRFEYKLALPALLSVVHDVWLSISIYSFTGREVTSATVAAILTILGYSLYDVVIVFDRIRENVPIMRKSSYREIVNTSVHETLTRSVITSLTTLIPITVLFFFGGDTLKDFAFALLVGILSGGLSSIAIAAPLAALWKEREPENKRRAAKARRRAAAVASTDADIVDVDALARAEASLQAELRLEENGGRRPAEEEYEEPEEVRELTAATATDGDEPDDEGLVEADYEELEPEAEEAPEPGPEEAEVAEAEEELAHEPAAGNGAGERHDEEQPLPLASADTEDGGAAQPVPRRRPDPQRVRRHRQVQKRRRR
jgi:SecD/SecF fusion protein